MVKVNPDIRRAGGAEARIGVLVGDGVVRGVMFSLLLEVPEMFRKGDFDRSCLETVFGAKLVPRFAGVLKGEEAGIFGKGRDFSGKEGSVGSAPFSGGAI